MSWWLGSGSIGPIRSCQCPRKDGVGALYHSRLDPAHPLTTMNRMTQARGLRQTQGASPFSDMPTIHLKSKTNTEGFSRSFSLTTRAGTDRYSCLFHYGTEKTSHLFQCGKCAVSNIGIIRSASGI